MDAQQERHKSQDCLGPVAPLASAAEVPSTAPVSGKKHRPPGPLFSSSDPRPATSSHSRDSAQVTSLIPAPFPAASMDAGIRRTRPGTSAPAAASAAPPPSTLNPMSGSLLNAVDGGPSYFWATATAAAGAQSSAVRYNQRPQTSWTSSCPEQNVISSSQSSTGGLLGIKQRTGPASSHCQLTFSSSKTVSEDGPQAVSSGHTQCEKTADIAPGQTLALRNGSPRSQASRPRINSELRAEAKAISDCTPSRPSHTLSSLATGTSGVPAVSKAPSMDAQQERHKSQDCLGPVAPLASAAEVPSTAPVSGKKHRQPGPLFSSSDPLPATSSHSQDSAQVTSLIPAPFPAASMDAGIRRTRPGTSAPAAASAAPPPSTLNPTSGSLLNRVDGGPSHFWAAATAAACAQRSEVRYKQRSQTSWTSSCPEQNVISSSYSSTGGLPGRKRRWGPASSHCQLTLSSSKTVSEDRPQAVSSGHTQCEKMADIAPGQTLALRNGSPRSQASRPRINSELRAEAKAISDCTPSRPSHTLSSLATGASGVPAVSKAPSMDAQQERHKSQDCLGPVAPLASAAEVPSTAPVSGKKHRQPGPLFSSSDPLPATSSHSQDSAQVTSLIPAPFPAASMDAGIRRTRPGTSAPAAASAAPPPSTLNPTSGSLLNRVDGGPSHFWAAATAAACAQRSEVRYKQRSQTSWTSSCPEQNAISSSYSSTGGLPGRKQRQGDPLMLPPPLELGFRVTAEDLDLEKEAAFQRINSELRAEAKAISDCTPCKHGCGHQKNKAWHFCSCSCLSSPSPLHIEPHVGVTTE
nr:putative POM121-like protein 1-like [Pongo pygmaeus]